MTSNSTTEVVTHTPGPWTAERGRCNRELQNWWDVRVTQPIKGCERTFPQDLAMVHDAGGHGRVEADARLIAAAPELLDDAKQNDNAFTWLAEQMNSLTDNAKYWTVAQIEALGQDLRIAIERNQKRTRVAIAKAEGGQ